MNRAIIFDMDGTLIDNAAFHWEAWRIFCERYEIKNVHELEQLFGKTNANILQHFFKRPLPPDEINALAKEKETIYRELYIDHIKPVPGLVTLLPRLQEAKFSLAVATSAPPENVEFALDNLKLKKWFSVVVDETMVSHGKPAPDLFLEAAKRCNARPVDCVVFEDAVHGIDAAHAAGMCVVALTTTHPENKLRHANRIIRDFTEVDLTWLSELLP